MSDLSHPRGLLFFEDWWRAQRYLEKERGSQLTWRADESEGYRTHLCGVFSPGLLNDGRRLVCHIWGSVGGSRRREGNGHRLRLDRSSPRVFIGVVCGGQQSTLVLRVHLKSF